MPDKFERAARERKRRLEAEATAAAMKRARSGEGGFSEDEVIVDEVGGVPDSVRQLPALCVFGLRR
jgi:hypothetical protein